MADDAARIAQLEAENAALRERDAATQAAVAVLRDEKADLADEVQRLRPALTEALEQQTATAEVLRVIASAPTETRSVLDALLTCVSRLCAADFASTGRVEGDEI